MASYRQTHNAVSIKNLSILLLEEDKNKVKQWVTRQRKERPHKSNNQEE